MRYFIFSTGGDWDSTNLFLNGEPIQAARLYIELECGRDEYDNFVRGGLRAGGRMQAFIQSQDPNEPEMAVFPGRIDLEFPTHKVTIENNSPMFAIEMTDVFIDGRDVSEEITEMQVNIDAVNDEVSAYLNIFKPHFFTADEIITYSLL